MDGILWTNALFIVVANSRYDFASKILIRTWAALAAVCRRRVPLFFRATSIKLTFEPMKRHCKFPELQ